MIPSSSRDGLDGRMGFEVEHVSALLVCREFPEGQPKDSKDGAPVFNLIVPLRDTRGEGGG